MKEQTIRGAATVIALHCSGAGAGQWRQLRHALGSGYDVMAPEHYGCDSAGPWTGEHAFSLADEAVRALELIDRAPHKVHLVGHSYGGGLALHVALQRADRIASMSLYEPSAFHLLKQIEGGADPLAEILGITRQAGSCVVTGNYRGAAEAFMDYWGGPGTWNALRPEFQTTITRWSPKAPLDFAALIEEPTQASAYARLLFPVLVIRGEFAPAPTRLIAEVLPSILPDARLTVVAGAGHLGPLSHAEAVASEIARHITETQACSIDGQAPAACRRPDLFDGPAA